VVGKYADLCAAVRRNPRRRQTTLRERIRFMLDKLNSAASDSDDNDSIFPDDDDEVFFKVCS
jgi:hypothetical protein